MQLMFGNLLVVLIMIYIIFVNETRGDVVRVSSLENKAESKYTFVWLL